MSFPQLDPDALSTQVAAATAGALVLLAALLTAHQVGRRRGARVVTAPTVDTASRATRLMLRASGAILLVVASIGAAISFDSMSHAAEPYLGPLAFLFPLAIDGLILGATLRYVAGVRRGQAHLGYRNVAYAGIAATVFFNALAATSIGGIWWHIAAPLFWGILAHLAGKEAMGHWVEVKGAADDTKIARVLWLIDPRTTALMWLHQRRAPGASATDARTHVAVLDSARRSLEMRLPGNDARRTRRVIMRVVRAGVARPDVVLTATEQDRTPDEILRVVMEEVLTGRATRRATRPTTTKTQAPPPPPLPPLPPPPNPDRWWTPAKEDVYQAWLACPLDKPMTSKAAAALLGNISDGAARNIINTRFKPRAVTEGRPIPGATPAEPPPTREDPDGDAPASDDGATVVALRSV